MNTAYLTAFFFASVSAIGNAIFAFGQKRAEVSSNPLAFLIISITVCLVLFIVSFPFMPKIAFAEYIKNNYPWALVSGIGFFFTFIGFFFLYTHFGASYYAVYAVLSIITTSIFVGIVLYKEPFNIYHALAVCCAIATILLFALGQQHAVTQT